MSYPKPSQEQLRNAKTYISNAFLYNPRLKVPHYLCWHLVTVGGKDYYYSNLSCDRDGNDQKLYSIGKMEPVLENCNAQLLAYEQGEIIYLGDAKKIPCLVFSKSAMDKLLKVKKDTLQHVELATEGTPTPTLRHTDTSSGSTLEQTRRKRTAQEAGLETERIPAPALRELDSFSAPTLEQFEALRSEVRDLQTIVLSLEQRLRESSQTAASREGVHYHYNYYTLPLPQLPIAQRPPVVITAEEERMARELVEWSSRAREGRSGVAIDGLFGQRNASSENPGSSASSATSAFSSVRPGRD